MKAVLLAAGEGTRLRRHTEDRPKCLVEVAGRPLLDWQLEALSSGGIHDAVIVTGYRAEALQSYGNRRYHNADYTSTNMVATLMKARDEFDGSDDLLIAYTDIVYEAGVVAAMNQPRTWIATSVDTQWLRLWSLRNQDPLDDAETLEIDGNGFLIGLGRRPATISRIEAQYMGLITVPAALAQSFIDFYDQLAPNGPFEGRTRDLMYMTSFLQELIDAGHPVEAVKVAGGWFEVDTEEDLALYERLRANGDLDELCVLEEQA